MVKASATTKKGEVMASEDNNPTADEACRLEAEFEGHDRYASEACREGGAFLMCSGCPFE